MVVQTPILSVQRERNAEREADQMIAEKNNEQNYNASDTFYIISVICV